MTNDINKNNKKQAIMCVLIKQQIDAVSINNNTFPRTIEYNPYAAGG